MSIEDSLTRRSIFDLRVANGQANDAADFLVEIYSRVEARILRNSGFQDETLSRLRDDIDILLGRGFGELSENINESMLAFAESEAAFTYTAMGLETTAIMIEPLESAIDRLVLGEGMDVKPGVSRLTMNEAIDEFSVKKSIEVRRVLADGILEGRTNQQIANEIGDLATHRHKAQVEALVRTVSNHTTSMARSAVMRENSALLKGEEWLATLDNRTTLICGGRDGRIYRVDRGPYPPAHWNCRSIRVPVFKDEFELDDGSARRPEIGADGRGTTTATTKFDGWLRRQPADFQDEYFSQFADGAEKAALFRRGGLSIQDFRNELGVNYTLEQLAALDPVAFRRANISLVP